MSTNRSIILQKFCELGEAVVAELEEKDNRIDYLTNELAKTKNKLKNVAGIFNSVATELNREE